MHKFILYLYCGHRKNCAIIELKYKLGTKLGENFERKHNLFARFEIYF